MVNNKLWKHNITQIDRDKILKLANTCNISEFLARIFINRGIEDPIYIEKFLNPVLEDIHDPFLLKDMDKAISRIVAALSLNHRITIYGDYDVDGITSTYILFNFLESLGASVNYYLPDREKEGYGISKFGVDNIKEGNTDLIITVDCGITAISEVEYINESNIDVVITDHHRCLDVLPNAVAVINPCRVDCLYPFKNLAGVGVVFKLIHGLCLKLNLGEKYLEYIEFVALGTISDVVSLSDENRIIVKYGLQFIKNTKNIGLQTLINSCITDQKSISTYEVGFMIGPRINVAGRMGNASRAVNLFICRDKLQAQEIVDDLNSDNKTRQEQEGEIYNNIVQKLDKKEEQWGLVFEVKEGLNSGIIGIVASKITDKYNVPCIIGSKDGEIVKASCRSIKGINIFNALQQFECLLLKYGGHELAAGFTMNYENVDLLKQGLENYIRNNLKEDMKPEIQIDLQLSKDDIVLKNVKDLDKLAPYGEDNPAPIFQYNNLKICESRAVGNDKHLKLKLNEGDLYVDAIAFNMGDKAADLKYNSEVDVLFNLDINVWKSRESVQFKVRDIKMRSGNSVLLTRDHLAAVYKFIKSSFTNVFKRDDVISACNEISKKYNIDIDYFKAKTSIDIFEELKLISKLDNGKDELFKVSQEIINKVNIEDSKIYKQICS